MKITRRQLQNIILQEMHHDHHDDVNQRAAAEIADDLQYYVDHGDPNDPADNISYKISQYCEAMRYEPSFTDERFPGVDLEQVENILRQRFGVMEESFRITRGQLKRIILEEIEEIEEYDENDEGNKFTGELEKARKRGDKTMTVGGKEYPVQAKNEAVILQRMIREERRLVEMEIMMENAIIMNESKVVMAMLKPLIEKEGKKFLSDVIVPMLTEKGGDMLKGLLEQLMEKAPDLLNDITAKLKK
jgi:hypothetical protein